MTVVGSFERRVNGGVGGIFAERLPVFEIPQLNNFIESPDSDMEYNFISHCSCFPFLSSSSFWGAEALRCYEKESRTSWLIFEQASK